jgi:hypothetical protein
MLGKGWNRVACLIRVSDQPVDLRPEPQQPSPGIITRIIVVPIIARAGATLIGGAVWWGEIMDFQHLNEHLKLESILP